MAGQGAWADFARLPAQRKAVVFAAIGLVVGAAYWKLAYKALDEDFETAQATYDAALQTNRKLAQDIPILADTTVTTPVDVVISGVYPVIAGGSISRKNLITSGGTDGTAIAESASAGTNVGVLGQAIEDGVSGDRVATVINPFIKQGG